MFVLAHLSDPHLPPVPQPRWSELMGKRATGYANWRRRRRLIHRGEVLARVVGDLEASTPDHIAVTGDLVNLALAGEYAPARAWLESLGTAEHVTLVPGNHDIYVRGVDRHARSHWGDYMRGDEGRGNASDPHFPFLRRRGPIALIGLSSAVPTAPFMATGRLGNIQIGRLAGLLDLCGREGRFRVVLIHHPPQSSAHGHFKRLIDGSELRAALQRHGAELVLHGHDHVQALTYIDGPQGRIPAIGAPSASQVATREHGPAGYNLCRIGGSPGAWRCELVMRVISAEGQAMTESDRIALY